MTRSRTSAVVMLLVASLSWGMAVALSKVALERITSLDLGDGQGCFNGLAHTIGFTLTGLKTKLPRHVVWGVSYNSDTSGPEPLDPEEQVNVSVYKKAIPSVVLSCQSDKNSWSYSSKALWQY